MPGYWDRWRRDDDEDPYVRWNSYGDSVEGVIVKMGSTDFGAGDTKPVLTLRTAGGAEKILNVSQAALLNRMAELSPELGDHLQVTYTGESKSSMPGRNPAKLFDVVITPKAMLRGDRQQAPAPPAEDKAAEGDDYDEPF